MLEKPGSGVQGRLIDAIQARKAKVGVLGFGYVGIPMAVEKGKDGFKVLLPILAKSGLTVGPRCSIPRLSRVDLGAAVTGGGCILTSRRGRNPDLTRCRNGI